MRLYGTAQNLSILDISIVTDFTAGEIARVLNAWHYVRRNNKRSHIANLQREVRRTRRSATLSA